MQKSRDVAVSVAWETKHYEELNRDLTEIFAFATKADRAAFIADIAAHGGTRWAVNDYVDANGKRRYILAIQKAVLRRREIR